MKKIISLFLTLVLVIGIFAAMPISANAYIGEIYFAMNSDGMSYSVVGFERNASTALIPETYNNYPVTRIEEQAFYGCAALTRVTIPYGVESIGLGAFQECWRLTEIEIPWTVTEIGAIAFYECFNLTSIEIPYGVKTIEDGTFQKCSSLISINIPSSVEHIGRSAFENCTDLKSITIPSSVETIEDYAFYGVPSDLTVYGTYGSTAELCANYYGFNFVDKNHTHSSSDWIIDKTATVFAAGSKHTECTVCGKILETAEIAQLKCSKPNLKTISNTEYGVKITWGKVSGADKYYVYRKTSGGSYSRIGSTTKTYYTDKTAKSGKKYYYIVKAINEAGSSSSSSSKSIYHLADTTLSTPKSTKSGITLKWKKVTGADGYMVYRKTGTGSYTRIATVKGSSKVTYTDKSAKKGKKYTYKVKAYKSKTYSAYSNTKTIKDKY